MGGWQDEIARKKRAEANDARGTAEYDQLDREAKAAEAVVNQSLRDQGQHTKY